ncbi:MAG: futalosine hydrolase [Bacteroidales bacterium]|nr:futalosine hydrolase [Bacteroidales bacterium]
MNLRILYTSATAGEAGFLRHIDGIIPFPGGLRIGKCEISTLVTGVGSVSLAWAMKQWLGSNARPDLAINAGIAGSYARDIKAGDVVMPVYDCFADLGIETEEGYLTLAEAGLSDPDKYPFKGGWIHARNRYVEMAGSLLRPVRAITVNTASGTKESIDRLAGKYNPDIETMEGAAFFYICAMEDLPFLAIRAVSNMVEPRNRDKWDIALALTNLSARLKDLFLMLE